MKLMVIGASRGLGRAFVEGLCSAGDTVIGTLALMLACGVPLAEAMGHANRAGGLVVAKFGTATLSHEELFA